MSLESDRHGQVSNVFRNERRALRSWGFIVVWCLVPGESIKQNPLNYPILEYFVSLETEQQKDP